MDLIVLILLILLIVMPFIETTDENKFSSSTRLLDCSNRDAPHNWTYNSNDKLECTVCGLVAGERVDIENETSR